MKEVTDPGQMLLLFHRRFVPSEPPRLSLALADDIALEVTLTALQ